MRWPTLTLLVGLAGSASAARTPSEIEQLDRTGREAFQAGDHAAAAEAFGALLGRLPERDPLRLQTLYNHARALQEASRPCDAQVSFDAYLGDQRAAGRKEAKRRAKAKAGAERAAADCQAQRAREAKAREAPVFAPVEDTPPPVVVAQVAPEAPPSEGFLLMAGLVTGAVWGEETARARTLVAVGAGWQQAQWIGDVEVRFSVEDPDPTADAAIIVRPGARRLLNEYAYVRAAAPIFLSPVTALGLFGGGGLHYPPEGPLAVTAEAGATLWLADPLLPAVEASVGVETRF